MCKLFLTSFCCCLFFFSNAQLTGCKVQYDGVYLSYDESTQQTEYLQFFYNGTVIQALSKENWVGVKKWFKLGNDNVTSSRYKAKGCHVNFTIKTPHTKIKYAGEIDGYQLRLTQSYQDGARVDTRFKFKPL